MGRIDHGTNRPASGRNMGQNVQWAKRLETFITHQGLYQYKVMPFGLVNSEATFSRIMQLLLENVQHLNIYLDY